MASTADALLLAESSDTITGGSSDNSIRTLTSQIVQITEPALSLILDPIVSYEDLMRDAKIKLLRHKAASSDDILGSKPSKIQDIRGCSSLDALNDIPRQCVTQQAIQLWNNIASYLKKNINSGRRQPPLKFKYYSNCFFGSEIVNCLRVYLGRDVAESSLYVLSAKLLHAGVIERVDERPGGVGGGGEGMLSFKESALYQFKITEIDGQNTTTSQVSLAKTRIAFIISIHIIACTVK